MIFQNSAGAFAVFTVIGGDCPFDIGAISADITIIFCLGGFTEGDDGH